MVKHNDEGYASLTAIVLCAVAALLCAGILNLTRLDHRRAMSDLRRLQTQESLNAAIMQAAVQVARSPKFEVTTLTIQDQETGAIVVRAEPEGLKWPLSKADQIDEALLKQRTTLSSAEIKSRIGASKGAKVIMDDCIRSLFSDLGYAPIKGPLPSGGVSVISLSSKEGTVWRMRATSKYRVQEQLIRFTGDSRQFYAIIDKEDYALGQLKTCQNNRG